VVAGIGLAVHRLDPGRVVDEALELELLVVEDDVVDLIQRDSRLAQIVLDRVRREARVVLLAREPLLLSGRRGWRLHGHWLAHGLQNFAPSRLAVPQPGQIASSRVLH